MKSFLMVLLFPLFSYGYSVKVTTKDCTPVVVSFSGTLKKASDFRGEILTSLKEIEITEEIVKNTLVNYDFQTIVADRLKLTKVLKEQFDDSFRKYGYSVDLLVLTSVELKELDSKVCPFQRK